MGLSGKKDHQSEVPAEAPDGEASGGEASGGEASGGEASGGEASGGGAGRRRPFATALIVAPGGTGAVTTTPEAMTAPSPISRPDSTAICVPNRMPAPAMTSPEKLTAGPNAQWLPSRHWCSMIGRRLRA